ncbi:MAG: hypothetical protein IJA15_03200 [Clostridia bacterium]|nr:hypothetical protein [Clostridia bacterium]
MKLFFKHLAKSVRTNPLQPIILLLTLIISVAFCAFAFSIHGLLEDEMNNVQKAQYGNADLTVSLNSSDQSRFMFAKEVEDILSDRAVATGAFELPLLLEGKGRTAFGVAVDFYDVEQIFAFEFLQYGKITHSTVKDSAFISQAFAKDNDLALGDVFSVVAFGSKKTYTVCAISQNRFLDSYDVMVDISGIVHIMTKDSLLLSALGADFKPCSTIFVRFLDKESIEEDIELLKQAPTFKGKSFTSIANLVQRKSNIYTFIKIVDVALLLICLLSSIVIFCCFYILSALRKEQNYAFEICGAKPWQLNLLQYAEILLYLLISAPIGGLLTIPLLNLLQKTVEFRYVLASVQFANVLKGALVMLAVCVLTATAFIGFKKTRKSAGVQKQIKQLPLAISLAIFIVSSVMLFVLPTNNLFAVYLVCMFSILTLAFFALPPLLMAFAKRMDARSDKQGRKKGQDKRIAVKYAFKNVYKVKVLHNISRLACVLVIILAVAYVMVLSAFGNVKINKNIFNADYLMLNSTEKCEQAVEECAEAQKGYNLFVKTTFNGLLLSIDDINLLSQDLKVEFLPKGNQVILTKGEAKKQGLKIGDSLTLNVSDKDIVLEVADIVDSALVFMLFDCEHFGFSYNILAVKGKEGVNLDALFNKLTEKTALELSTVITVEQYFDLKINTVLICVRLGEFILVAITIFAIIGAIDNLYESYRTRRDEFTLFYQAGMNKKALRQMKASEITISLLFGIVLGFVFAILLLIATNQAFYTFSHATILNVLQLFKG